MLPPVRRINPLLPFSPELKKARETVALGSVSGEQRESRKITPSKSPR